jgi:hypothetical protein
MTGQLKRRVVKATVVVLTTASGITGLTFLASPAQAAACAYRHEAFAVGEVITDSAGAEWICTSHGWQKLL